MRGRSCGGANKLRCSNSLSERESQAGRRELSLGICPILPTTPQSRACPPTWKVLVSQVQSGHIAEENSIKMYYIAIQKQLKKACRKLVQEQALLHLRLTAPLSFHPRRDFGTASLQRFCKGPDIPPEERLVKAILGKDIFKREGQNVSKQR